MLVAIAVAAAYFAPELKGMAVVHPWARSAPTDTVDRFASAVRAKDRQAVEVLAPGVDIADDFTTMLTPRAKPREPARPVAEQLPAGSLADAEVTYMLDLGEVKVETETEEGKHLTYRVSRRDGEWVVLEWRMAPRLGGK